MLTQSLNERIEQLTFTIDPESNKGGVISVSWDKLKASIGFTTVP